MDSEESTPTPLVETPQGQAVLDRQISALYDAGIEDVVCLAGYHIEKLVDAHPEVSYYYDPDWEEDGHVAGLTRYPELRDEDIVLTSGEMLFETAAVEQLRSTSADICVAVNQFPSEENARQAAGTLDATELICIEDGHVKPLDPGENLPDARMLGLLRLSPDGVRSFQRALQELQERNAQGEKPSIESVVTRLVERDVEVATLDVGDSAQRYDEQHALARFLLGTKADTLERLDGLVTEARVLDQVVFNVASWEDDPQWILDRLRSRFPDRRVVVRSSAVAEDGWHDSHAGAFHTELGVETTECELTQAIDSVAESLREGSGRTELDQILVQPEVENVAMSGVAFTRDLDSGGPYTVINVDDVTGRTDTITAGQIDDHSTIYLDNRLDDLGYLDDDRDLSAVKAAIDELRDLLDDPPLDVEFAVDESGTVTILQVRPLAVHTGDDRYDLRDVGAEIDSAIERARELNDSRPLLFGEDTVLAVMPDWNPAEMIGTRPTPLAVSLYRYLITDHVWARARAESGYRDVRPAALMVTIAGRPYIDTLVDFNSFVPATLPDELADDLVTHYVQRLAANPDLHDKVEFEVAFTCLDFAFEERREELVAAGFDDAAIETIREHLRRLTDDIVSGTRTPLARQRERLVSLGERRQELLETPPDSWAETTRLVSRLLADTRRHGTLPFAILARDAFIAESFLRSLVVRDVFTAEELDRFKVGIETVAEELSANMRALRRGNLEPRTFFETYGHLRPGTYDITSPRYDEEPENYFDVPDGTQAVDPLELDRERTPALAGWSPTVSDETRAIYERARDDVADLIAEAGFTFDPDELFEFVTHAIPLRELAKFAFTRNLSAALALLERGAREELNLCAEDLARLPLHQLLESATENPSPVLRRELERDVNHNSKRREIQRKVQLPPVVREASEIRAFEVSSGRPNFITEKSVTAEVVTVDENTNCADLDGKIALIPSADPGYDWIFGCGLAGLVTKYGGVASHMAIRAAEFGLPAAIGCGELLYERVASADTAELYCAAGQLREGSG